MVEEPVDFSLLLGASELLVTLRGASLVVKEPQPVSSPTARSIFRWLVYSPLSMGGKSLVVNEPRYRHYRFQEHTEPLDADFRLLAGDDTGGIQTSADSCRR